MAGLLSLRITGQAKLIKGLKIATQQLSNPTAANKAAVIQYEGWVKKNIDANGGLHEDGRYKNWKKVTPAYAKWKRKQGKNPGNILKFRGDLRNRWFRTANKKRGILRSGVYYSSYHEFGSKARGLPQRKIFPSRVQGNKIVRPVYRAFVNKAIKGLK